MPPELNPLTMPNHGNAAKGYEGKYDRVSEPEDRVAGPHAQRGPVPRSALAAPHAVAPHAVLPPAPNVLAAPKPLANRCVRKEVDQTSKAPKFEKGLVKIGQYMAQLVKLSKELSAEQIDVRLNAVAGGPVDVPTGPDQDGEPGVRNVFTINQGKAVRLLDDGVTNQLSKATICRLIAGRDRLTILDPGGDPEKSYVIRNDGPDHFNPTKLRIARVGEEGTGTFEDWPGRSAKVERAIAGDVRSFLPIDAATRIVLHPLVHNRTIQTGGVAYHEVERDFAEGRDIAPTNSAMHAVNNLLGRPAYTPHSWQDFLISQRAPDLETAWAQRRNGRPDPDLLAQPATPREIAEALRHATRSKHHRITLLDVDPPGRKVKASNKLYLDELATFLKAPNTERIILKLTDGTFAFARTDNDAWMPITSTVATASPWSSQEMLDDVGDWLGHLTDHDRADFALIVLADVEPNKGAPLPVNGRLAGRLDQPKRALDED